MASARRFGASDAAGAVLWWDAPVPSASFAHRELNGQLLLEELRALREAQVRQRHLEDCAQALRGLEGMRVGEASRRIREIASGRFTGQPALASLMVRWAAKMRVEEDVAALGQHFRRLALTAALVGALRRGGASGGGAGVVGGLG